jgi:DNA topoisomerase-1
MSKVKQTLVIVESPAKCKKIESYLGLGYKCVASFGHIRELNKKKGIKCIDIENNYKPDFNLVSHQLKNISSLKKNISLYDEVLLATDDDREGEAIAWHICQVFKLPIKTTKRIIFHEITKTALEKAVKNPTVIDMKKVESQKARQVLDLLVGYSISPLLWKYINKTSASSLSAGRCQSPALRLVYDNYNEIKENPGEECYSINGMFDSKNLNFKLNKTIGSKELVKEFLEESKDYKHKLTKYKPRVTKKKSPEPFTTSSLQQKASNILHYSPKDTMRICQNLYESGLITYMRTDSKYYSKEFIDKTKSLLLKKYGSEYISESIEDITLKGGSREKKKTKKNDNAQEAHEAIRPTDIYKLYIEQKGSKLGSKEVRMYNLIWKNTIESCMSDALYKVIKCELEAPLEYKYSYSEEIVEFDGWTIIEEYDRENELYNYLLSLKTNSILEMNKIDAIYGLKNMKQHYTEAKLVSLLEKKGIGRPSTFSSIISKIQERGYVKKNNIEGRKIQCEDFILEKNSIKSRKLNKELGNEMNKLVIQPLGILVIEFLVKYFPSIFDYKYTKEMERSLDKIAEGNKVWYKLCDECYNMILDTKDTMTDEIKKEFEFNIDEKHKFKFARYGPVIEYLDECGKKNFYKIKENIKIEDIRTNKLKLEDIVETDETKTNKELLGYIDDEKVLLKKGKFGLFLVYKEKNYSLKGLKKKQIDITIDDAKEVIDKAKESGIVREINNDISIRNGKYGHYIFYKTSSMKKPKFIPIKKCPLEYLECSKEEFMRWFDDI